MSGRQLSHTVAWLVAPPTLAWITHLYAIALLGELTTTDGPVVVDSERRELGDQYAEPVWSTQLTMLHVTDPVPLFRVAEVGVYIKG